MSKEMSSIRQANELFLLVLSVGLIALSPTVRFLELKKEMNEILFLNAYKFVFHV